METKIANQWIGESKLKTGKSGRTNEKANEWVERITEWCGRIGGEADDEPAEEGNEINFTKQLCHNHHLKIVTLKAQE